MYPFNQLCHYCKQLMRFFPVLLYFFLYVNLALVSFAKLLSPWVEMQIEEEANTERPPPLFEFSKFGGCHHFLILAQ